MHGVRDEYKNEQHKKAMQATIDKEALDDKLRRKGLL